MLFRSNQLYLAASANITLNYSCYGNGNGDVTNNGGTYTLTNNNITSDPLFVNTATNDFRLYGYSPGTDAGLDSYNSLLTDIRGTRLAGN